MDEAIMALRIAVRDAERGIAAHWVEVQDLEQQIAALTEYLAKARQRHSEASGWLDGLLIGLSTLEKLHEASD